MYVGTDSLSGALQQRKNTTDTEEEKHRLLWEIYSGGDVKSGEIPTFTLVRYELCVTALAF